MCVQAPSPGARVVYIDGAFDLFHAGHVEVTFVILMKIIFS
jgi:bifunctional ADP-heptose synthase (sugar kinase/adenylyltransferase)